MDENHIPPHAQQGVLALTSGYDPDAILADRRLEPAIVGAVEGYNYEAFQLAQQITDVLAAMSARTLTNPPSAVLAQLESNFAGATGVFMHIDKKHCEDFEFGILGYCIQASFLKICLPFMTPCEEAKESTLRFSGRYVFSHDATGDGTIGPETRERRRRLLDNLRASLQPVWHLYGLSDEQVAAVANGVNMEDRLQDIVGEVETFIRVVSKCVVTSHELLAIPSGVSIDPAKMNVILGGPAKVGEVPTVVCTADMGLRSRYRGPYGEDVVIDHKKPQVVSSVIWVS